MAIFKKLLLRGRLQWLELRWSYPYRWAHKPRCESFHNDVLRLGHVQLCRSCVCVYGAMALTAMLLIAQHETIRPMAAWALTAATGATLLLSLPLWYKRFPRRVRDAARATLGVTLALDFLCLLTGHVLIALSVAALLLLFWRLYFMLRRHRKSRACDACPHLAARQICPGFAYQAERIRRYEEEATELLLRDVPNR